VHSSSETIGAIAGALAKAQGQLTNPEKSLSATIRSPFPREGERTFRYASLSSGLDIVRKALGQQQIATIQTTAFDADAGLIRLTTVLAHASGEWISSDWPVCPVGDASTPHRMGAALTYARRYALFTLVGIAGEDDLDAPDLPDLQAKGHALAGPTQEEAAANGPKPTASNRPKYMVRPPKPVLAAEASAALRDQLLSAIAELTTADELAEWAHQNLPSKNTLIAADARAIETAYQAVLDTISDPNRDVPTDPALDDKQKNVSSDALAPEIKQTIEAPQVADVTHPALLDEDKDAASPPEMLIGKTVRRRNKAHRLFVAAQPCLICGKSPSDAHHLRFAQPRALGRKVSDEFAVPLCRAHHRDLHHRGNEIDWWGNIDPIKVSEQLWRQTLNVAGSTIDRILTSNTIKSSFRRS
jgi:hypothetical protein